ncbi:MAG: phosphoribosylformylglycinamidine synthase subunit PurS [bacterium]
MKAIVTVTLKRGVLDPQGQAVAGGLKSLGFDDVEGVRVGKHIEIELGRDGAGARERVTEMCKKLLANPVIEDFSVRLEGEGA